MKKFLENSSKLGYVIPAFFAGTLVTGTVAIAATNLVQAEKTTSSSVSINGQRIAETPRLVYGKTSYVGLWALKQGLNSAGYSSTWDGNKFNIEAPQSQTTSVLPTVSGYHVSQFVQGTASASTVGPDDITLLNGHIYVAYQNGVGSKGEAASSGNLNSTIVEYSSNGTVVSTWSIRGKCDGMTADVANNRVLATVNEDGNSSMYIVTPGASQTQHLTYNPDPATAQNSPLATGGGTDSIAIQDGNIYISASAPSADKNGNYTNAAVFRGTIHSDKVSLSPVFMGNDKATDAVSGTTVDLNLSDPDSSTIVPTSIPKYAGDFMLDSQGDSELIFAKYPGAANQSLTRLSLGTQVDDTAWATASRGTLYVTDGGKNTVYEMTGTFTPGTVFVACPSDSGVAGFVGTLDLNTGTITPIAIGFKSPKGLAFVPKN